MKVVSLTQCAVGVAVLGLTGYRCFEQAALNYGNVFEPSILNSSETLLQFDSLCGIVCLAMLVAFLIDEAMKAKSFSIVRPAVISLFAIPFACILSLLLCIALGAPIQGYDSSRQTIMCSMSCPPLPFSTVTVSLALLQVFKRCLRVELTGTCHLAVIFGSAAFYPWLMAAGFNSLQWQQLTQAKVKTAVAYPVYFAAAGGLIGATPLPLDWAQPWQTYPAPIQIGMALGLLVGSVWPLLRRS
eukprot:m.266103 g.266103  ORF g.266103 m.266103 type:complete len:243 (-) comp17626_c0_seq7:1053-1781(-)